MPKTLFPALVLAGFTAVAIMAQQPSPNPAPAPGTPAQQPSTQPQSTPAPPAPGTQPETPAPAPQTQQHSAQPAQPVQSTANPPEADNVQLRPVTGELEKKLDSKNAKPGDAVVVKTTENATIADGVEIPKGSRIMGHITDVQAHSSSNENSRVTLQFDQAQLKGGQTLPIRTVLESVAPAEVTVHPTDTMNTPSGMAAPGDGTGAPGGMSGGRPAGSPTGTASAGGGAPATAGEGPATSPATQDQAANAAPKVGTVVARQGNVAIKTTSVPGVLLATNADGKPFSNAAGALLGAKRNVHLDGGTEIVLAVMDAAPPKPGTK